MATLRVLSGEAELLSVTLDERSVPLVKLACEWLRVLLAPSTEPPEPLVPCPTCGVADNPRVSAAAHAPRWQPCVCDPSKAHATVDAAAAADPSRHCYACGGVKPVPL